MFYDKIVFECDCVIKYLILDFGKVLGYSTTGYWNLTPKSLELIDIKKYDFEKLKHVREKSIYILSEKMETLEQEYDAYIRFYSRLLPDVDLKIIKDFSYDRTYNFDKYTLYNDTYDVLRKMKEKYRLILLSDNRPSLIPYMDMEKSNIYNLFDRVYVSSIYGQEKKDGLFFDNPINDYNIKSGEAVFIDNNEKLLDIASSKGLKSILMDGDNKVDNSKYNVIHNLEQLCEILDNL